MKRKLLYLLSLPLLVLTSSCSPGQLSPEQIESTAQVIAATGIPLTLTAMPSDTEAPTATPQPSATSAPVSPSPTETVTDSPTVPPPTYLPTWTPYGLSDADTFATNQADKADLNAPLFLENKTEEEIHFILLSPRYQEYLFSGSMSLILPEGQYTYRAWIGNKGPINGTFSITNGDKHVLTFHADKIHFATP